MRGALDAIGGKGLGPTIGLPSGPAFVPASGTPPKPLEPRPSPPRLDPDELELLLAWKPDAALNRDTRLRLRREPEAVVLVLTSAATAPQEQSVRLPPARPRSSD